jgi:hypothetical protein
VKFAGQVLPTAKKITYIHRFKRVIIRKLVMGIADAKMEVDGRLIYEAKTLKLVYLHEQIIFKVRTIIEKSCYNRYGYCIKSRQ